MRAHPCTVLCGWLVMSQTIRSAEACAQEAMRGMDSVRSPFFGKFVVVREGCFGAGGLAHVDAPLLRRTICPRIQTSPMSLHTKI